MRSSEWIQAGFAVLLAVAAWIAPLSVRRRFVVSFLAAFAITVIGLGYLSQFVFAPVQVSILRDWLPVPLTLVPYWQTGQFFAGPNEKVQNWLVQTDRFLLCMMSGIGWASPTGFSFGRFARLSMEWAYMLCYPIIPLGLATLYAAGLRSDADTYWYLVLTPTYLCYLITPFVPALPPRSIREEYQRSRSTKSRVFNLWILKYGSIQAISFPSAHVASSLAVSLVVLRYLPFPGAAYLAITFWIAVAAVVGGYHYAIDVVLGAVVTIAFYWAWCAHLIPSTLFTTPAMSLLIPLWPPPF